MRNSTLDAKTEMQTFGFHVQSRHPRAPRSPSPTERECVRDHSPGFLGAGDCVLANVPTGTG